MGAFTTIPTIKDSTIETKMKFHQTAIINRSCQLQITTYLFLIAIFNFFSTIFKNSFLYLFKILNLFITLIFFIIFKVLNLIFFLILLFSQKHQMIIAPRSNLSMLGLLTKCFCLFSLRRPSYSLSSKIYESIIIIINYYLWVAMGIKRPVLMNEIAQRVQC